MTSSSQTPWAPDAWRAELRLAIKSTDELLKFVGVEVANSSALSDFPTLVPRGFAARMQYGDPQDPLLRQVLERQDEQLQVEGFVVDPLMETAGEMGFSRTPGLIHKYHGRALLIATGGCAVHCRYCFRRHFPYQDHRQSQLLDAVTAVADDSSIEEIILSGGDPLLLDDDALARLVEKLAAIDHLKRLRIHTRIPVVLPQRITSRLTTLLANCRLRVVVVIHSNHSNELDASTARALGLLRAAGVWLMNQAVLLHGVNDNAAVQIALAKKLFDQDVQPYYLHMPDRVAGTHHFFVEDAQARQIYKDMQAQLPGYLLPKLVREIPGETAKRAL
jgi:EF-P beta-lysylation protein EpmB